MIASAKALALPMGLLLLWQAIWVAIGVQSDTLAAPSAIIVAFGHGFADGSLLSATGETLAAAGIGLALGATLGLLFGIVFGLIPPVSRLMGLSIEILRPIPSIAIVPIAILIFGFGYVLEIAIVAFACFFPILLLTEAAIRQITPRLLEVARVLRLSGVQQVYKIVLPAALPRIFVALRLAAGIALIVAVTVEIVANPIGLGTRLMQAGSSLRPADMFATLLWVGFLGWFLNWALVRAERALFPAHALKGPSA